MPTSRQRRLGPRAGHPAQALRRDPQHGSGRGAPPVPPRAHLRQEGPAILRRQGRGNRRMLPAGASMTSAGTRARRLYRVLRSRLREYRDAAMWGDLGLLAPAARRMAESGNGTDACREQGWRPMPVPYCSPVPHIADLQAGRVWNRRSAMAGVDMREAQQLALLAELGRDYGTECRWPHDPGRDDRAFYTDNSSFSY